VDCCYIEKHRLPGVTGSVYIWTILDNYSRSIVASAPSKTQNLWDFLLVLFTAIYVHGAPIGLVSDGRGVFKSNVALDLYEQLGIEKTQIERRKPWQDYVESHFLTMKHLERSALAEATTWEQFCAIHARFVGDFNHQAHFAHQHREDGLRTPAEVLGGVQGRLVAVPTLQAVFALLLAQRKVDRSGYIRYDGWRVYGEEGLSGQRAGVWLAKETRTLTLTYAMQPVAQYDVTFGASNRGSEHGTRTRRRREITELREHYTFPSPLPSPQPHLWAAEELQAVEWRKVYRLPGSAPRRRRSGTVLLQVPLLGLRASPCYRMRRARRFAARAAHTV
jgi:hypothetical protein